MNTEDSESVEKNEGKTSLSRRDVLKGFAATTAAAAVSAGKSAPALAVDQAGGATEAQNPYGGGPNTGITLPPYYRPTPSVANANTLDRKSTRLNSSHLKLSRMPSSA